MHNVFIVPASSYDPFVLLTDLDNLLNLKRYIAKDDKTLLIVGELFL